MNSKIPQADNLSVIILGRPQTWRIFMLKACASSCTDFLMRHTNITSSRRPIYLYGFELLLSTLTSALSILFVSVLFNGIEDLSLLNFS